LTIDAPKCLGGLEVTHQIASMLDQIHLIFLTKYKMREKLDIPICWSISKTISGTIFKDEYHSVLICNTYTELRHSYFHRYFYTRPSMYKFVKLVNSESKKTLLQLSNYVLKSMKLRVTFKHSSLTLFMFTYLSIWHSGYKYLRCDVICVLHAL